MNATPSASKQLTVKDRVKLIIPSLKETLQAKGVDIIAFQNNAVSVASSFPEINNGEVSMQSVANVCMRAANDGVIIDGIEAAMVMGYNGKTKQKEAQYRLMVQGVINKMYKSGNFKKIIANVVREGEDCVISYVTDEVPVTHAPKLSGSPGDIIGVYCVAKLTDGTWTDPVYMTRQEIDEVRKNYSKQGDSGMWAKSWEEAAKKTVLHRAKKRWPIASAVREELNRDMEDESEILDIVPTPPAPAAQAEPAAAAPAKKQTKAASAVKAAAPEPEVMDVEYTEGDTPEYDESPV